MITSISIDARTAYRMMDQVTKLGLRCHMQLGFPFEENGHRICRVTLEYDEFADYEVTNLMVAVSERATHYVAQPYLYPREAVRS